MSAPASQTIQLSNIYKHFTSNAGATTALKNINLTIAQGDFVAIMGPSGAGKTSILNIIGLLDKPTSGIYMYNGTDMTDKNEHDTALARRADFAFIFQSSNLLPKHSIIQNVQIPLLYRGFSHRESREYAMNILDNVGLSTKLNNLPNQLSAGQLQRAAIARAIVQNPKIILADEPTGNLDTASAQAIMAIFKELNHYGMTIIMVTHNSDMAKFAHRTVYVRDGQIVRSL